MISILRRGVFSRRAQRRTNALGSLVIKTLYHQFELPWLKFLVQEWWYNYQHWRGREKDLDGKKNCRRYVLMQQTRRIQPVSYQSRGSLRDPSMIHPQKRRATSPDFFRDPHVSMTRHPLSRQRPTIVACDAPSRSLMEAEASHAAGLGQVSFPPVLVAVGASVCRNIIIPRGRGGPEQRTSTLKDGHDSQKYAMKGNVSAAFLQSIKIYPPLSAFVVDI